MSWVKLDDGISDHPKLVAISYQNRWLFVRGLCHSARYLTDGFVSKIAVKEWRERGGVKALVDAGLWIPVEGGWRIHDYLEMNPSKERVEAEREAARERKARWRAQLRNGGTATGTDGVPDVVTDAVRNASPSRPVLNNPPYPPTRGEVRYAQNKCPECGLKLKSKPGLIDHRYAVHDIPRPAPAEETTSV